MRSVFFRFRPLQTAPAETVSWFVASADFCSKLSEFALNNNLVLSLKNKKNTWHFAVDNLVANLISCVRPPEDCTAELSAYRTSIRGIGSAENRDSMALLAAIFTGEEQVVTQGGGGGFRWLSR